MSPLQIARPAARGVLLLSTLLLASGAVAIAPAAADPRQECENAYAAGDLAASRAAAERALAEAPDDGVAHWLLARALIDLGNREAGSQARETLYAAAESHARRAVALCPDDTWSHHYLAASLGKLALSAGGKRKIELSKEVRGEALRAVEIDPRNDRSLHILGRWNREIANLSPFLKLAAKIVYGGVPEGATNERAVDFFQRAIAIDPARLNHRLELGLTFMEMEEYAQAVPLFQSVLDLPAKEPNDADYKVQAAKQLPKAQRLAVAPRRDVSR